MSDRESYGNENPIEARVYGNESRIENESPIKNESPTKTRVLSKTRVFTETRVLTKRESIEQENDRPTSLNRKRRVLHY